MSKGLVCNSTMWTINNILVDVEKLFLGSVWCDRCVIPREGNVTMAMSYLTLVDCWGFLRGFFLCSSGNVGTICSIEDAQKCGKIGCLTVGEESIESVEFGCAHVHIIVFVTY